MSTVRQAFHDFLSRLNLTEREQEDASAQHVRLRNDLSRELVLDPLHQTFLSGSYARKTAIRPLDDIDVFCVLKPTDAQPRTWTPRQALDRIHSALRATNPGKEPRIQNRSVNIAFTGTGIAYDVVPAFVDGECYLIPDLQAGKWIRSNPKVHAATATAANEGTDGDLKRLTKAVKHWNRSLPEADRLRSFLLEVMAWEVLTAKPEDALSGTRTLFDGLADRLARGPVPEPARLGPNLDDDLSGGARSRAVERLRGAGTRVGEAIACARDGEIEVAHHVLRDLFGDAYPERGAPRRPSVVIGGGGSAPDRSGSRFG